MNLEILKQMIEDKNKKLQELKQRSEKSEDINELRNISKQIEDVTAERNQLQSMIDEESRKNPTDKQQFNPMQVLGTRKEDIQSEEDPDDIYSTLNYRKAFKNYFVTRKMPEEYRAAPAKTTDVTAVIPTNLINQILETYEQLGVIYNLVTKTSYPVGQVIPVDGVKPTASWVAEGAGSTAQGKDLKTTISFNHYKLRCEVRITEEVSRMSLSSFEALFVKQVGQAMLRAVEGAIVSGTGTGQPKGILAETAPTGQALTVAAGASNKLTYKLLCDAEAAIPTEYEATAKWCMTKKTFMQFIGMTDSQGQPIARVNYGIGGKPERTLLGRDVIIYVPQTGSKLGNYQDAATADILFAFIVDFSEYVLNNNYDLGISNAIDWDTEDHKTKAVAAYDGKLLRNNSLVTLTKTKSGAA